MALIDEIKKCLKEEYGIETEEQLDAALKKVKGPKIGIFVTKPERNNDGERKPTS